MGSEKFGRNGQKTNERHQLHPGSMFDEGLHYQTFGIKSLVFTILAQSLVARTQNGHSSQPMLQFPSLLK